MAHTTTATPVCFSTLPTTCDAAVHSAERAASQDRGLLLIGNPGMAPTMVARRLTSILPTPTDAERDAIAEQLALRNLPSDGERPFRAPHHSCSDKALAGCWRDGHAGEVHLARYGVLYLDDLPEFRTASLRALMFELRDLRDRDDGSCPLVVASALPCPCGWQGSTEQACTCPKAAIVRHQERIRNAAHMLGLSIKCVVGDVRMAGDRTACETSDAIRERVTRRRATGAPLVGDLATYSIGSDSYAYTVVQVSRTGHRVTLQARHARRVDDTGYGGAQSWITWENADGATMIATRRKDGEYRPKGGRHGHVAFGHATPHQDPHF